MLEKLALFPASHEIYSAPPISFCFQILKNRRINLTSEAAVFGKINLMTFLNVEKYAQEFTARIIAENSHHTEKKEKETGTSQCLRGSLYCGGLMTHRQDARLYQCKALTDLWTGSVDPKAKDNGSHLVLTGLLGSIRWWFEVLVRGLGGAACDPTNTKCEGKKHCVACELFGCTGWARKFRFDVLEKDKETQQGQITKDAIFHFRFTPLRPVCDEEWALLDATLRLIAKYGAIGGKTIYKPSDERGRENKSHHKDYGLIAIEAWHPEPPKIDTESLEKWIEIRRLGKDKHSHVAWASFQNFWCVKGKYLSRQSYEKSTFNFVLGREEPKRRSQSVKKEKDYGIAKWLSGSQQNSKKVFSFKEPDEAVRTFGFVRDLIDFTMMRERLREAWNQEEKIWDEDKHPFLEGEDVMNRLFSGKERRS